MFKVKIGWVFLGIAVFLSGCAATGPQFTEADAPQSNQALLHIYRKPAFAFSTRTASFAIDGDKVAELLQNGYTRLYLKPGVHLIKQTWNYWLGDPKDVQKPLEIAVPMEAGQQYFVSFDASASGLHLEWVLQLVDNELGFAEILSCKEQPNTHKGFSVENTI